MILLDTHALIWWVSDPARIPGKAREIVDGAIERGQRIGVSSISIWEIAMLVERGRLAFTMSADLWVSHVEALPFLSFLPVDNRIAMRAVSLDGFPQRDPADRIIAATAIGCGGTLVTADSQLRGYEPLTCVWD